MAFEPDGDHPPEYEPPAPTLGELATALAAVQAELPIIGRNTKGQSGSREHRYADLAAVSAVVLPLLGKHGLAFTARPTLLAGQLVLAYSLMHSSGERLDGAYPLPAGTPQQVGSAITYGRRYCLCAVTGAAPEAEDDDGAAASQAQQQPRRQQRAPKPQAAANGAGAPDEDLWAGQPSGEFKPPETSLPDRTRKPYTPAQLIAMHWHRLGITDDEERLNWTARMAGRTELASTTNLPPGQQQEILSALAQFKDVGQVQAWIDDKAPAS